MAPRFPSRYQACTQFLDADGRTLLTEPQLARFRYQDRADNLQARVLSGDRLWDIAHRFYAPYSEAGKLSWVLALYNGLPDQTLELEEGSTVYGPSPRVLFSELFVGLGR